VDSHVHFTDVNRLEYTGPIPSCPDSGDWDVARYYRGIENIPVKEIIFVEVNPKDEFAIKEIEWVNQLPVIGMVANVPVERGHDFVSNWLDSLKEFNVCGIRRCIQNEPSGFCTTPLFIAGVKEVAKRGYPFDLCIKAGAHPYQMAETLTLVQSVPECQFILDHIGKPNIAENQFQEWSEFITKLSKFSNVYCKISGVITESGRDWTPEKIEPYVRFAIDSFGYTRCIFGSDWWVCNIDGNDIKQWFWALTRILKDTTEEQRKYLFRETCLKVYRRVRNKL